ncbi:hypothetical protein HLB23_14130 [Nocardia uniformis]|uniref:Uncharacterized protein n=1 Tax=Nocardia uniformis TaxID=53432 RepID=A0A849C595_9NOCA|nr:hypothetical protein [Nocardia uniformis]NNH70987.1 hypothetical protein [Nocardia uniformis]
MCKGSSKSTVQHFTRLADGTIGCWVIGCSNPASRWIDMERWGIRCWLSTAYCGEHGDNDLRDPHHVHRVRPIS